jgi:hypothetical protein
MCLVFSGLSAAPAASRPSGLAMPFAKKADGMQKLTVSG